MKQKFTKLHPFGYLFLLFVLLVTGANAQTRTSSVIIGTSPFQDSMWVYNQADYSVLNRLAPTTPGFTITGINSIKRDPTTGIDYAILKLASVTGRVLATIDVATGVCTQIGNLGDNFATLAFNANGTMYGVTGNGATVPETMYWIDKTTAAVTLFRPLGAGADGEVIEFCPDNNKFYHWSGNGTVVWERFDTTGVDPIESLTFTGAPGGETFGAAYIGNGQFLISNISSTFTIWDTLGNITATGASLPDDNRGLIVTNTTTSITAGGPTTFCAGNNVVLTVNNAQSNYQWYMNGTPIIGETNATYTASATGVYNNIYTDSLGITDSVATGITVISNALPVVHNITGGGQYCAGDAGVPVGLDGSEAGVDYQLYDGVTPIGTPVAGTGSAISFGNQTLGTTFTAIATNTVTACASNMNGSAVVTVNPVPVVYTISGGGSYCSGGAGVNIGLSGSDAGIEYQLYNGMSAVGAPMAGTGAALDFGLHTTPGSYTIVATNTTTLCTSNMSGTATIIVNPLPVVYNVTGGGNYCAGDAGVLVGLDGSETGVDYQLYDGVTPVGTAVAGTGAAISFGLQTTGTTYTVIATNATTGCVNNMNGNAVVAIDPLPNAYNVTGGGTYCAGGAGFSIGLSNSDIGIDYQLYNGVTPVGAALAGTGAALDFGFHTAGGTYTVIATNTVTGCTNTMSSSAVIVVNPLPAMYNVIGGGSYCAGGTGVNISLDWSDAGIDYQLYDGVTMIGAPLAGVNDTLDFGMHTAAGTYTILATDAVTGCTNYQSGSATVVVIPTVVPSVSIWASTADTICQGTWVMFTATPVNGGGSPSFQWKVNGVDTATGSTFSYIPDTTNYVSVTLTSSEACPVPDTAIDSFQINVLDNVLPIATVTANPSDTVCVGTTVNYTVVPTYGGTAPTYTWVKNTLPVATGTSYTDVPAHGDVVFAVINSNYMCLIDATGYSNTIFMTVQEPVIPSVVITASPGLSIAAGTSDTLTAVVTSGAAAPIYQWYKGSTAITGATSSVLIRNNFVNGDSISCVVTNTDACGLYSFNAVKIRVRTVGVASVANNGSDIMVMPNPSKGVFTVKGTMSATNEDVVMEVSNMLGQVVYSNKVTAQNGAINENVQLSNVASGMYILSLRSGTESKIFHIVIAQ